MGWVLEMDADDTSRGKLGERAEGIPGSGDLLLTTSLRRTFAGSSGTGIGSGTAGAAPLVH